MQIFKIFGLLSSTSIRQIPVISLLVKNLNTLTKASKLFSCSRRYACTDVEQQPQILTKTSKDLWCSVRYAFKSIFKVWQRDERVHIQHDWNSFTGLPDDLPKPKERDRVQDDVDLGWCQWTKKRLDNNCPRMILSLMTILLSL